MIRLWDFATCSCGEKHNDMPIGVDRIPETIVCQGGCGKRVGWVRHRRLAQIHPTASGMKYGSFDPQFGCVVEDYPHRQRLLKEKGMVDVSGPERMDDIMNDGAEPVRGRNPAVGVAGSPEELMAQMQSRPDLDRKHTGPARERLLDSWVSFDPNERG